MNPRDRYMAAAHAMQSGVAMDMRQDTTLSDPKHLRVGINTAHADIGSLSRLLIAKGVISEDEYLEAIADGMEREKTDYERRLSARLNTKITLA